MHNDKEQIWATAQHQLRSILSADIYNLWFAPLRLLEVEGEDAVVEVANDFCEVWLKENYLSLIEDVLATATGDRLKVRFKVTSPSGARITPAPKPARKAKPAADSRPAPFQEYAFNPKNTFESFVVGDNNNFAYAASLAVAQSPGKSYNPLFLYGGVGLGKTHLLHGVGQHVVQNKKGARVAYLSSEKFANEYIDALQNNQLVKFRKKYRQTDVLLIDDIHFHLGFVDFGKHFRAKR